MKRIGGEIRVIDEEEDRGESGGLRINLGIKKGGFDWMINYKIGRSGLEMGAVG
jgi:hypothetical protein